MDTDKTILVVENDHILLGIYKEILELHDYDVQTASNGAEGVKKFRQVKPSPSLSSLFEEWQEEGGRFRQLTDTLS